MIFSLIGMMPSTIVIHQKQYMTGFENTLVGMFYSLQYLPQIPVFRRQKPQKAENLKVTVRKYLKKAYYFLFPIDPKYPLEKQWLKNASKFRADTEYDLVISNSSPAASHKLVAILSHNGHLKYKRWIQIWEDPWYYDLYGGHKEEIFDEENALLNVATEVFYVSPLTLVINSDISKKAHAN